ncbi:MAG: di-heme oxidoredictase family protein [Planctomycetota bacterium]
MSNLRTAAITALCATSALVAQTSPAATGRLGGPHTVRDTSGNAFGFPSPQLSRQERRSFLVGNSFFRQNWVETPSSAPDRDGLGPLFNARSCSSCHLRDGRSAPPAPDDVDRQGLLIRIGVRDGERADVPHATYGGQIQDVATSGFAAEARVVIDYRATSAAFADGTPFELLAPSYSLSEPAYGDLGRGVVLGPRTAPALVGLGLLQAIPAATLQEWADADDVDGDGISGRVHVLADGRVGRFGWKATQPDVREQVAGAFVNDMGITSSLHPAEELTAAQRATTGFAGEANIEIDDATLLRVVFYTETLAVPAQRDVDDGEVQQGRALFTQFGCVACHRDDARTGDEACHPSYRDVAFAPYTDLLLHDMGAELADEKRDGDAAPAEWRTPPLWGIGLLSTVNGHSRLLHDGRARGVAEAILWHGGEGEAARERFRSADAAQRRALLRFVESL